jgi:hypothetical protein
LVVKWTTLQYSISYSVRRLLGMQWWNFRDNKMLGIARLVEDQLASQKELCSMELVSFILYSLLTPPQCSTLPDSGRTFQLPKAERKVTRYETSNHNCVWKTSSPNAKKIFTPCSNCCCSCYIQNTISVKTWISQLENHCCQFLKMKWRLCQ